MSQYKKGQKKLVNNLVLFAIATVVAVVIITVMSAGIGGQADNAINLLTQN